jgi:hypothetical protein
MKSGTVTTIPKLGRVDGVDGLIWSLGIVVTVPDFF